MVIITVVIGKFARLPVINFNSISLLSHFLCCVVYTDMYFFIIYFEKNMIYLFHKHI